jgi:hypothetical protein
MEGHRLEAFEKQDAVDQPIVLYVCTVAVLIPIRKVLGFASIRP